MKAILTGLGAAGDAGLALSWFVRVAQLYGSLNAESSWTGAAGQR
jgi:hypothetical protein